MLNTYFLSTKSGILIYANQRVPKGRVQSKLQTESKVDLLGGQHFIQVSQFITGRMNCMTHSP